MTLSNSSFNFLPDVVLNRTLAPSEVTIKGLLPKEQYSFNLLDLYQGLPVLDTLSAFIYINRLFDEMDIILAKRLHIRASISLPNAKSHQEAMGFLQVLFDIDSINVDSMVFSSNIFSNNTDVFEIPNAAPFSLEDAPKVKLLHSLVWIDTNMKLAVERIAIMNSIPPEDTQRIAEVALTIYCILVKMQDYKLARTINFNHSMFIQNRIINLVFGDNLMIGINNKQSLFKVGALSNLIALRLLQGLGEMSYRQLCTLSVFMGVVWTNRSDIQRSFDKSFEPTLAEVELMLKATKYQFCIDHIEIFLHELGEDFETKVVVILDDNGESVFDVALFQQLLRDTGHLKVIFVVNRFPISNNIALNIFLDLIADPFFTDLRRFQSEGRVLISVENQPFPSFEESYLTPSTRSALDQASFVYVKGVSFFETFQPTHIHRYYCFTVTGMTSMMLTGCKEGKGVFAYVPKGQAGYLYHSADNISTLKQFSAKSNRNKEVF